MSAAMVVLAAGSGTRFGAPVNKAYLRLGSMSILARSLRTMVGLEQFDPIVLVIRERDRHEAERIVAEEVGGPHASDQPIEIVTGADTRQGSELCALEHLRHRIDAGEIDSVLIHDSARPLVTAQLCADVLLATRATGSAMPAHLDASLAVTDDDGLSATQHTALAAAQTPQGFAAQDLLRAYDAAATNDVDATDTAAVWERYVGSPIRWVSGDETNFKITWATDLQVAEELLAHRQHGA